MPHKSYYLDTCHTPMSVIPPSHYAIPLRSGEEQGITSFHEINHFFTTTFKTSYASFCDFSPSTLATLLTELTHAQPLATLQTMSYPFRQALAYLQLQGQTIIWVDLNHDGTISQDSLAYASSHASFFLYSVINEDTFIYHDYERIRPYFHENSLLCDVSLAPKTLALPSFYAQFLWGYKKGSYKNSGVVMSQHPFTFPLAYTDMMVYQHCYESYQQANDELDTTKQEYFQKTLTQLLPHHMTFPFVSSHKTAFVALFDGVMARDMVRGLALEHIFVTNGELCSLGLSQPSYIFQKSGLSLEKAMCCLSISCVASSLCVDEITYLTQRLAFKYRQILALQ